MLSSILFQTRLWWEMKRRSSGPENSMSSLILPWTSLVILAILIVILDEYNPQNNSIQLEKNPNDKGYSFLSSWIRRLLPQGQETSFHEPLFPLSYQDFIGFSCATVGLMIAAGGGIGGGGVLVPIYILVMGFSPKHAIPLSNVTVLGGAVANSVLNFPKRHPLADRPLVDWDLILVMEPLTIAGALIGAFLNKLLPEELLVIMLVVLLSFTANKTLKKAVKMYGVETRLLEQQSDQQFQAETELTEMANEEGQAQSDEERNNLLDNIVLQDGENHPGNNEIQNNNQRELRELLLEEREAPMINIYILVIMFVVVLFINLLKGGGAFPSPLGIKCGSTSFWVANGVNFVWILAVSWYARSYLIKRHRLKSRLRYQYVEGDIQWDESATLIYPAICCLAGFFAGMFGVGGGIVKGPLMLAMGVHPAVSSASSACMILFTSFTATTSFVVFGLLISDYAVVCATIGFLATLVGQIGLSYLMRKYKRNSYILFSIGGIVFLSAVLMTIQSLVSIAESKHHHSGGVCGKEE